MPATLDPKRVVDELKELRALTGDENGAQRVAFTDTWMNARAWMHEKCTQAGLQCHRDPAGNAWAALPGESQRELLIGGHIDSVPNGGCARALASGMERRANAKQRIRAEWIHCDVDTETVGDGTDGVGRLLWAGDHGVLRCAPAEDTEFTALASFPRECRFDLPSAVLDVDRSCE